MARSLIALSLIALSLLKPAAAGIPYQNDKSILCTHLCFNKYGDNSKGCFDSCMAVERPTPLEAHQCFGCIDNCVDKFSDPEPNLVMLRECKESCVNHYFPNFNSDDRFKVRRDIESDTDYDSEDGVTEHLPGLPKILSKLLAENPYPVEAEICVISCRVKFQDTILSDPDDVEHCREHCLANPTDRDRALQASLDCGTPNTCSRKLVSEVNDTPTSINATAISTNITVTNITATNITATNLTVMEIGATEIGSLVKRSTDDDECMEACFYSMSEQRVSSSTPLSSTFDASNGQSASSSMSESGKNTFAGKSNLAGTAGKNQVAGTVNGSSGKESNSTIKTYALAGGDDSKSGAFMQSLSIFYVIGTLFIAMAGAI